VTCNAAGLPPLARGLASLAGLRFAPSRLAARIAARLKARRTGINGCSAMAHPLTHLTHGIPTRRPFHPAKTASAVAALVPGLIFSFRGGTASSRSIRLSERLPASIAQSKIACAAITSPNGSREDCSTSKSAASFGPFSSICSASRRASRNASSDASSSGNLATTICSLASLRLSLTNPRSDSAAQHHRRACARSCGERHSSSST
jgi:hypothetical protein